MLKNITGAIFGLLALLPIPVLAQQAPLIEETRFVDDLLTYLGQHSESAWVLDDTSITNGQLLDVGIAACRALRAGMSLNDVAIHAYSHAGAYNTQFYMMLGGAMSGAKNLCPDQGYKLQDTEAQ